MRLAAGLPPLRAVVPWLLIVACLLLALRVASGARLERADLVFNNGVEITTLDPATVTGQPEGRILQAIYEGLLVKHPRTLAPQPGQAEKWAVSPDGLTYKFRIRDNAFWSNGEPVTAGDFLFSFRRVLDPATAAEYAYQLWYVRGARDYSTWPDDVASSLDLWVAPVRPGPLAAGSRVRVGVSPPALAQIGGLPKRLRGARVGDALAPDETFFVLFGKRNHIVPAPFSGRVTATHPEVIERPASLVRSPFARENWLFEVELDEAGARQVSAMPRGEAWRNEVLWPRVGMSAPDDKTLILELESPTPFFLDLMSFYPLFPVNPRALARAKQRWPDTWQVEWIRPENLVTNGPYRVLFRRINDRIRLVKNPRYWDAENVALETIDALAVEHYGTALNLYLTGECDWLNASIPNNLIPRIARREDFLSAPYLGSYFYRVNVTKPPLDDPRVRLALALSIDREAICTKITKAGQRPLTGLVPPGIPKYQSQGFGRKTSLNPRSLMKAAGYGPRGKEFPPLEILYNTSETHRDIAEVVADGWRRELGIDVRLLNQEWKVYLDSQANLRYDIARAAWIADYPDANSFLDLFVTDGENNKTGWSNPEYDALIAEAAHASKPAERIDLLERAERILVEEMPILPIYSYASQNLVNPRLGGFYENLQDVHFPKFWYWLSDQELAEKRKGLPPGIEIVEAPGPRTGKHPAQPIDVPVPRRAGPAAQPARKAPRSGGPAPPVGGRNRTRAGRARGGG